MTTQAWALAALFAAASVSLAQGYRVGVAAVPITPEPATGQWLAGLGDPEDHRVSEGAHDDIWCRAFAVGDGETTVVFAVCDLIGLFLPEVEEIARRVTGVPAANILVGATHVHSAPDTLGLWGPAEDRSGVDPAFLEHVRARAAQAVQMAVDSMEPAVLAFAEGRSPDRTAVNYNDPWAIDNAVTAMQARRANGQVIGTLVNWACHPEVMWTQNKLITSDFAHYLRDEVEGEQGGVCVYFNGALGGMVSPVNEQRNTWDECERIGRAVGAEANRVLTGARPAEPTPIAVARVTFDLPMGSPALIALQQAGVLDRGGNQPPDGVTTAVAAVGLGPAQFVTLPGEALPAVGFLVRTMMDAPYQFLLGLTLDELGYILPPPAVDMAKYRYEQTMSIHPQFCDYLLPRVLEVMNAIKPAR